MLNPVMPSFLPVQNQKNVSYQKTNNASYQAPNFAPSHRQMDTVHFGAEGGKPVSRRVALAALLTGIGAVASAPLWWPDGDDAGTSARNPGDQANGNSAASVKVEPVPELPGVDYRLQVDYTKPQAETFSMAGLLNGFNTDPALNLPEPSAKDVKDLKPQLWRMSVYSVDLPGQLAFYDSHFNPKETKPEVVLSDMNGLYPFNTKASSWSNPQGGTWQDTIRAVVNQYRDKVQYWDVWNEPDLSMEPWKADRVAADKSWAFWGGSFEQFMQTFQDTSAAIKSVDKNLKVVGPSLSNYDEELLTNFLQSCVDRGIKLDVLSWHELNEVDRVNDFSVIEQHLKTMKDLLATRFSSLGCSEIHINELVGTASTEKPGNAIAYKYYAERGGANKSVRASWNSQIIGSNPENRSYNNTVGGLLKPNNPNEKKAAYLAEQSYAEASPSEKLARPESNPAVLANDPKQTFSNIVAVASPTGNNSPKTVLVAYGDVTSAEMRDADNPWSDRNPRGRADAYPAKRNAFKNVQLTVTDATVHKGDKKHITETHILNTPESADDSDKTYKPVVEDKDVQAQADGQLALKLENIQPGELRKVVVQ